tara:strand:+ start:2568 stop:2795 length:228 start_codon:yes stop_codon:yes gene_type:complete
MPIMTPPVRTKSHVGIIAGSFVKGKPPAWAITGIGSREAPIRIRKNHFEVNLNRENPVMRGLIVLRLLLKLVLQM